MFYELYFIMSVQYRRALTMTPSHYSRAADPIGALRSVVLQFTPCIAWRQTPSEACVHKHHTSRSSQVGATVRPKRVLFLSDGVRTHGVCAFARAFHRISDIDRGAKVREEIRTIRSSRRSWSRAQSESFVRCKGVWGDSHDSFQ